MLLSILFVGLSAFCGFAFAEIDDATIALGIVNQAREVQGMHPLAWSPTLASYATFWAREMGSDRQPFTHAPVQYRPQQGENLYQQQTGACDESIEKPMQNAMRNWLSQVSLYTGHPITTGHEPWLHWSQCLWSNTTHIGCDRAYSVSDIYKVFVVCRFFPQGNIVGQMPF